MTYQIQVRNIDSNGKLVAWENTEKTLWNCASFEIDLHCRAISRVTGREVRYNKYGSVQGWYIGTTTRRNKF